MTIQRKRGRPPGTGIDDGRFLDEVADLMQTNSRIRATTAMRRIMKDRKGQWVAASEQAMLRRLQDKWKIHKADLQAEALRRAEARTRPVTVADVVDAGARLQAAIRACQTPEAIANRQRITANLTTMIERVTEPFSRVQQALAMRSDVLDRINELSKRIDQIKRVAEPVARVQQALALRSGSLQSITEATKQIEYLNRIPEIRLPKL